MCLLVLAVGMQIQHFSGQKHPVQLIEYILYKIWPKVTRLQGGQVKNHQILKVG
jgi:hypothetical protein